MSNQTDVNTILHGDARQLSQQIPDASIDLIFTDPPYVKEQMYLYEWLSQEGARVLKPDGFLMAYVGNYWMYDAMQLLATHLTYYWAIASVHRQSIPLMWGSWARNRYKTILVFVKHRKHRPRKQYFDLWTGGGDDKRFHHWGQDESTARYYIDCFSAPGSLVWDPFCGGGTTAAICTQLHRNFITYDNDEKAIEIARTRLKTIQPFLIEEEKTVPQVLWTGESEAVS